MKYKILKMLMPDKSGERPFVPYSTVSSELNISVQTLHNYALELEPEYLNIAGSLDDKSLIISPNGIDYVQNTKKQNFYNTITVLTFVVSVISLIYQLFIS